MGLRRRLAACLCLALAAVFAWLFYERYWKWRDCIHAAKSSCVTPDGQNLIAGGMMWGLLAAVLALLALRLALRAR